MSIYREITLHDQTIFQKTFGLLPKENAFIEINNLLAQNENQILTIKSEEILQIGEKYKVNLSKSERTKLIDLFKKYLMDCLQNKSLNQSQIDILNHLKTILLINEQEAQEIIKKETENILYKQIKQTFDSGKMDDSKWESLEKLKSDLQISSEVATNMYQKYASYILEKFLKDSVSDKRYSPDEAANLNELAKNFGADLKIDSDTDKLLKRYKLFWEIDNGNLPTIKSDINLQGNESLHFKTDITWQEQRKVITSYNYAGPTARFKIAKGVSYRLGSMSVRPQTEDVWQTIDSGTIYLTNKRLIFMGQRGNKTIPLNKILDFKPYSDGVDIQKDSGKSPFLKFSDDTELFAMILHSLMNQ